MEIIVLINFEHISGILDLATTKISKSSANSKPDLLKTLLFVEALERKYFFSLWLEL